MKPPDSQDGRTLVADDQEERQKDCRRLVEMVYEELRRIAQRYMASEPKDLTLQATALVNEAYVKLQEQTDRSWNDEAHFFAVAAKTIREILVDHSRKRRAIKRGGDIKKVNLDEAIRGSISDLDGLLTLDQALNRLERVDPRLSQIVELKYFAGLTVEEIADVMKISERTVKRDWEVARLWLHAELTSNRS